MRLAFHVFSIVLFVVGGLMTVFDGASIGSVMHSVLETPAPGESLPAAAPLLSSVKGVSAGAAQCVTCKSSLGVMALAPLRPLGKPDYSVAHFARPLGKPARRIQSAHQSHNNNSHNNNPVPVKLSETIRNDAGTIASVSHSPEFVTFQSSLKSLETPTAINENSTNSYYRVQPASLRFYSESGFQPFTNAERARAACWTVISNPAGTAWSPDSCRPSVLQSEEVTESIEPINSPYHVGFTTKIRHSVVGLRISRKLN